MRALPLCRRRSTLSLIELTEPDPPPGAEPVHWRLLTTHAVPDAAAAWRIVALVSGSDGSSNSCSGLLKKQGLRLEDSQVRPPRAPAQTRGAIATQAAVITSAAAQARDGRSDRPGFVALYLSDELGTFSMRSNARLRWQHRRSRKILIRMRSLAWAAWSIARLGGLGWISVLASTRPHNLQEWPRQTPPLAHGWGPQKCVHALARKRGRDP